MSNADRLINSLSPVINEKCCELRKSKKDKIQSRLFIMLCAFTLIVPTLFVFIGFSLTALITPVLFMSVFILILLPILLNGKSAEQGDFIYEQA